VDLAALTNGVYEFELTATTTVEVVFAGYDLAVTINDSLMGAVLTTVMLPGTGEYVAYNATELPSGTSVRLTWTTNSGCEVDKITVNDETATISNPTGKEHIFTLTEDTTVKVVFTAGEVSVANIYVNPDAQAGGNGSLAAPFCTLQEAKEKIAELIVATPNSEITVHLMGGTYRLDAPLELGVAETSYNRVSFVDYAGDEETPVITSAKVIAPGSFTKVSGENYYSYQLPDASKVAGKYPQFRDLLVDGELATLAKTDTYLFEVNSVQTPTDVLDKLYVDEALVRGITTSNIGNLEIALNSKWNSIRYHLEEVGTAEEGFVPLKVKATETAYFPDFADDDKVVGKVYWLQNHMSFLDEPGEFYYEETTGTIYYYPYTDQDMSTIKVEYPTLDTLIEIGGENVKALVAENDLEKTFMDNNTNVIATLELEGVANFTFDGITFTGTTFNWMTNNGFPASQGCTIRERGKANSRGNGDPGTNVTSAAIYAEYADGICVQNCTFTQLGGHAMLFNYGIDDLQVIGNSVTDIGMVGINVGINQRRLVEDGVQGNSSDVVISNNYVSNVGMVVLNAPAIRVARAEDLKINHNTVIHTPYSAIVLGWGFTVKSEADNDPSVNESLYNAEVAYNYIEDNMYALNDGGAIYTNGANDFVTNTEPINFIHHNYIRAGAHNGTYTGVYYDGSASNWYTYNNVIDDFVSKKGPMFFQDDVPNQYSHNIKCENNFTTASEIKTTANANRNIQLVNNTTVTDRSLLSTEALEIKANAGVENDKTVDPMKVALQIADNTVHYVVDRSTGSEEVNVKLTNNSDSTRIYTLSLTDKVSEGLEVVYPEGLELEAGESGIATITLKAIDKASLNGSITSSVVGIRVTDNTGRVENYPRTFSVETSSEGGTEITPTPPPAQEVPEYDATLGDISIAYGTPVLDGIMDDMYKDSYKVEMGPIIYPKTGNPESDLTASYYLLWDQTYLYCYAVIEESTVMSRGMNLLSAKNPNDLWKSDTLEFWLTTTLTGSAKRTKFAVDAFGIQRYGNAGIDVAYHESFPYATAFTYNGNVIADYKIESPTEGQKAATPEKPVTGYVIEMAVPLNLAVGVTDKSPWVGDKITIQAQSNDLQEITDGEPYVVAFSTDPIICTLNGKVSHKEVETTPIEVEIHNIGVKTSGVSVMGPDAGWVEGTNTFTVSSDDACVVAVRNEDGSYSPVTAITTDTEGVYSYTVDNMTAETEIVVALSGDTNGDGKVSNADITKLRAACAGKAALDGIQSLLGDVNGNGKVTNADITRLRAACAGKKALNW